MDNVPNYFNYDDFDPGTYCLFLAKKYFDQDFHTLNLTKTQIIDNKYIPHQSLSVVLNKFLDLGFENRYESDDFQNKIFHKALFKYIPEDKLFFLIVFSLSDDSEELYLLDNIFGSSEATTKLRKGQYKVKVFSFSEPQSEKNTLKYLNQYKKIILDGSLQKTTENKMFLIACDTHGNFSLKEFAPAVNKVDIELNYGASFAKKNKYILSKLDKKSKPGLVLLHGEPGTGKTHYIRYLTQNTNRKVVFFPGGLIDRLASPDFLGFAIKSLTGSLVILEDAEKHVESRNQGAAEGIENILNLTDGILGDCLNISIVATFNSGLSHIDKALLRKGRLIEKHKFDALSFEQRNKLMDHLNIEFDRTNSDEMVLADIYNLHEPTHEENQPVIGFAAK